MHLQGVTQHDLHFPPSAAYPDWRNPRSSFPGFVSVTYIPTVDSLGRSVPLIVEFQTGTSTVACAVNVAVIR